MQKTSERLAAALLVTVSKYSIRHKICFIALTNGPNNILTLTNLDKEVQNGLKATSEDGMVNFRCMNHALNSVFRYFKPSENHHAQLLTRIDMLIYYLKNNINLKAEVKYVSFIISKQCNTRLFSHHQQLEKFPVVSKVVKKFLSQSRFN